MTMMGFHELFPEEAERECRTVRPINDESLPEHQFIFTEAYCFASNCDCRRVMVNVIDADTHQHVATLNYGFDPPRASFRRRRAVVPRQFESTIVALPVLSRDVRRNGHQRHRLSRPPRPALRDVEERDRRSDAPCAGKDPPRAGEPRRCRAHRAGTTVGAEGRPQCAVSLR